MVSTRRMIDIAPDVQVKKFFVSNKLLHSEGTGSSSIWRESLISSFQEFSILQRLGATSR